MMGATLGQILMLVGRLDDSPGFDSARERFRRFLDESAGDVQTIRALIEQAHRAIGEQPHRALQDAVVVLGRFLGFETTFGTYLPSNGEVQYQGYWRSRRRLHLVLEILSDETPRSDEDGLSRQLAALSDQSSLDADVPRLGLSVLTPRVAARARLADAGLTRPIADRRSVSTRSLLWLADMVSAGRISPDEIVKLLISGSGLDVAVELLERFADPVGKGDASTAQAFEPPETAESEPDFWAATIDRREERAFERVLESAVSKRHVLGVGEDRALPGVACAGDWICFFLPGKGVVGHAQVLAPADAATPLMRDSDPSSRVYRLKHITLYDTPIVPDLESQQHLIARHERSGLPGPLLVPLSRQKFEILTMQPPLVAEPERGSGPARVVPAWSDRIDRASRSRA
jgi:hypothetical protein